MFLQFLESAMSNSSQGRNILKRKEVLVAPMLDARSQLVSIFNEDKNTTRKLSLILSKGP